MGMGCNSQQCSCWCVGTCCTQDHAVAYTCAVVVHGRCSVHYFCAGHTWRHYGEQIKTRVSCVPCVLRICCHHGRCHYLQLSLATEEPCVLALRLWRSFSHGARNSRHVGGPGLNKKAPARGRGFLNRVFETTRVLIPVQRAMPPTLKATCLRIGRSAHESAALLLSSRRCRATTRCRGLLHR